MNGKTKKRNISAAKSKNSDVNTLLLQKISRLSNSFNDENIFQQFTNKPCQKVDAWFSFITKKK